MKALKRIVASICLMSILAVSGIMIQEASGVTHFMIQNTTSWGTRTLRARFNPSINTWRDDAIGLVAGRRVRQSGVRLREGNRDTGWQNSQNVITNTNQGFYATASQFNNPFQVQTGNWRWIYR